MKSRLRVRVGRVPVPGIRTRPQRTGPAKPRLGARHRDTSVPGSAGARVVVVLGYSDGGSGELHPVCAARLARAAEIARPDDIVVLSGWARVSQTPSEASLMRAAWQGATERVLVDEDARTTAENAANAVGHMRELGAREVVVVTSSWHAGRSLAAFRWRLRRSGSHVRVVAAGPPGGARDALRELALWPLLPAQLLRARRPPRH
jgi:uncharacterized SAM-binding protein YcdF (DUF218 family)